MKYLIYPFVLIELLQQFILKRVVRNWIFSIAALLLLVTCASMQSDYELIPLSKKFSEVKNNENPKYDGIIRLKMNNDFHCTAFVIDGSYALTAGHCVVDRKNNLMKTPFEIYDIEDKDTTIKALPAGKNLRGDIGLVVGDFRDFEPLTLSKEYGFGAEVVFAACGFPYGDKQFQCQQFIPKSSYYFQVIGTSALFPGMSGGPVINTKTEEVVGINSAVREQWTLIAPTTGVLGSFQLQ